MTTADDRDNHPDGLPDGLPDDWPEEHGASSDHDLLLGGLADGVAENRASAQRWLRLVTFYRRPRLHYPTRCRQAPHFALTAREVTVVEIGELWGMAESRVGSQLNTALAPSAHLDLLWQLCLEGRCDAYRAGLVADLARHALDDETDLRTLGRRLERYLRKHLKVVPGLEELAGVDSVVSCTPKQLRNRVNYEIRKLALPRRGGGVPHGTRPAGGDGAGRRRRPAGAVLADHRRDHRPGHGRLPPDQPPTRRSNAASRATDAPSTSSAPTSPWTCSRVVRTACRCRRTPGRSST